MKVISIYLNRGKAFYYSKDYKKAVEDYTKVIRLVPEHDIAYNNRGLAYFKWGYRQVAIEDFRKAASLGNKAAKENLSYY